MSRSASTFGIRMLLRCYPQEWRARYGEELATLVVQSSGTRRTPWRIRLDVVRAAARERLRVAGVGGGATPGDRARGGALLVLQAWALFMVAGAVVQKVSEHWQEATPPSRRGLPAGAFHALAAAAAAGSILVLAGIVLAAPAVTALLRAGGWGGLRRPVLRAAAPTALAVAMTPLLVVWAHRLSDAQRNGHDALYGAAVVADALLIFACLAAWTRAAVATARGITLPAAVLRLEAWLAAGVGSTMAAMTAATAVWWAGVASAAPWFFGGRLPGATASPFVPALLGAAALMLVATGLGAAGAVQALRALAQFPGGRHAT